MAGPDKLSPCLNHMVTAHFPLIPQPRCAWERDAIWVGIACEKGSQNFSLTGEGSVSDERILQLREIFGHRRFRD